MGTQQIPLSGPDISEDDIRAVTDVLRTSQLSLGRKLPEFETAFAAYCGTKHAIAVNSGTSALHLCVRALDIKDGDEVITTPFSFVASANCILFERATPVFVDILQNTLCIDPAAVESAITSKTKAILAVDVFGYLCDWSALRAIANKHNLVLIEDSCEALGSSMNGIRAGAFGDCGVFGFYPNKQMTTGEGGMIVTDNDEIAFLSRSMRNQGRDPDSTFLEHKRLGYNFRLSDINCALGISQLQRVQEFIAKRAEAASWYDAELARFSDDLITPLAQVGADTSWFVYVARLADHHTSHTRDTLIRYLQEHGVGCNNYFPSIHLQPFYAEKYGYKRGDFPITEAISDRSIALPFFTRISRYQVAKVAQVLEDALASL